MDSKTLECPIDVFLDHYAPFKPSDLFVDEALKDLKASSLVSEVGSDNNIVWTLPKFTTAFDKDETGFTIFKNLELLMHILQNVHHTDGRKCSFSYNDCKNLKSEGDGTAFRVDACITTSPKDQPITLSDAAVIAEFKRASTRNDTEGNRPNLVSAAAQIMNDDPRRTCVYGITIEHTQLAVWYFCRSHSVKSVDFNFTTDAIMFTRVFLSLLFATGSEIGFDPTVSQVVHKDGICYVYQVGTKDVPRYYRTTELLFSARMLSTTGRKTRVWKVIEVVGPDPGQFDKPVAGAVPMVLKDGWLDEGSQSEKEAQDRIFKSLDKIQPKDYKWAEGYLLQCLSLAFDRRKYKEYFMEIIDFRLLGKTKVCHESAKQPDPDSKISLVPELKPIDTCHLGPGTTQSGNHSATQTSAPSRPATKKVTEPQSLKYKIKQQHRLIYRDVGCDLNHSKDLAASFSAIHDAFVGVCFLNSLLRIAGADIQQALVLLYLAGWTHRDISTGNIIVVEQGSGRPRGKLNDLEFAKEFTDETSSADSKMGTPFFMPVEIHSAIRLYRPHVEIRSRVAEDPFSSSPSVLKSRSATKRKEGETPLKFRFQHDVESLWWVMLWILLYRVGGNSAHVLVADLFTSGDTPASARVQFLQSTTDGLSSKICEDLKPVVPSLLDIRTILYESYKGKRSVDVMDLAQYPHIYREVCAPFMEVIGQAVNMRGVSFQIPPPPTKKRGHSEVETGTDEEDIHGQPRVRQHM